MKTSKLKSGQRIKVYKDPDIGEGLVGVARLIKFGYQPRSQVCPPPLELWHVRFSGDEEWVSVRIVNPEHLMEDKR